MTGHAGGGTDVLRWPVVGSFLRWRHARTSVQLLFLLGAVAIVAHGLAGPQIAPANLGTVATWVHYRGLLVVALLAAGNLFCMGCPFVLVRDAGRRLRAPRAAWPGWLRTKWIGLALFAAVLFTYELYDLWSLPRATAWLVVGYFGAALAVDLVFTRATFCKYLCPIGQFNFVTSTVSPLEVRVREPETCRNCRAVECIRGRRDEGRARVVQRGCELGLFLPGKVGNLDCTFCLDCVQACPYENVAIATRTPGLELVDARRRSGVGRLARRWDIAALVVLFVFGGLLNAFAMTAPIYAVEQWLAAAMGVRSETPVLAVLFLVSLVVAPLVIVGGAVATSSWLNGGGHVAWRRAAPAAIAALVPLGAGIWLAHYGFHLLTGIFTIVPVTQSAAADLFGWELLGAPRWTLTGATPGTVFPLQLGAVIVGTMGSIGVAHLIAERDHPERPWRAALPWMVATAVLAVAALWILAQPMEMRAVGLG